ncbi:4'-phosphopantetheinyl transferase [Teredinibacter sp. KSP-S5-2]|uniref:4'-phosphopantetheinyl transferase family protein n=1 Tax=Teredinibacter sp. KSP-S5-2 TaxID=3034506 RepID=UPI002934AAB2|nr:4'-phosphopantetheinyl transferase superfamily protein [Teredinibacter sp. KSP-S5-2]WNO11145.1 4'-phosphopantetheinyl transferase superfamily protein [Teredinibacter sp. KSP-S5-2]
MQQAFIQQMEQRQFDQYYECEIHYDLQHYQDSLYDEYGVSFPENLSNAVAKRKADFLCGRIAAKCCLQFAGLLNHESVGFTLPVGNRRAPIWPEGVIGSITHTVKMASAVVAKSAQCKGIGIDIEHWVEEETYHNINSHILTDAEHALMNSSSFSKEQILTLIFSAKEALFKALYPSVKVYFDFLDAELTHWDEDSSMLVFHLLKDIGEETVVNAGTECRVEYKINKDHAKTIMCYFR